MSSRRLVSLCVVSVLLSAGLCTAEVEEPKPPELRTFETPEEAFAAYRAAADSKDPKELPGVVGPAWAKLMEEQGALDRRTVNWQLRAEVFLLDIRMPLEVRYEQDPAQVWLLLGAYRLPMPLVKKAKGWVFDRDTALLERFRPVLLIKRCQGRLQQLYQYTLLPAWQGNPEARFPRRLGTPGEARPALLLCPAAQASRHGAGPGERRTSDYLYIPGVLFRPQASAPLGPLLAFDRKANHGTGRVVLRANGQVEWMGDETLFRAEVLKTLELSGLSLDVPAAPPPREWTTEEQQRLAAALKDLGSEDYARREAATRDFASAGEAARPYMEQGRSSPDVETQERCKQVLRGLDERRAEALWVREMREELGLTPQGK